jgi:uncharacterized protein (TIGR04255 family)
VEDLSSVCYEKTFLKEVVVRVDFVSPLTGIANTLPKDVSTAALSGFPIDEPKPAFTQAVSISKDDVSTTRQDFTEWNFHGLHRDKRLVISPLFVLMVHNRYERFEFFRDEFCQVIDSLFNSLPNAQASRIGLRFINQIDVSAADPLKWRRYVSSELLGVLNYRVPGAKPSRLFSSLEFAFDTFSLRFQYGIHNPDYPAPITQRQFTLDFDAYYRGLVDPHDIRTNLDTFHSQIQRLFERSITQKLRGLMRDRNLRPTGSEVAAGRSD